MFALVTKKMAEAEKLFAFVIEEDMDKATILDKLSRAICDVTCRTDYVSGMSWVDSFLLVIALQVIAFRICSLTNKSSAGLPRSG